MMKGGPFIVRLLLGLGRPKIKRPGVDVAGEVEAVGKNVALAQTGRPGVRHLCWSVCRVCDLQVGERD